MIQKNKMTQKNRFRGLDDFKITAAFLVMAIHTSPLSSFSAEADFIFTGVIARIAVPFFFMVTGYFLLPQYLFGRSMDRRPLVQSLKKHLLLYITAVLLYLPVNLYAEHFKGVSAGGIFRMLLADGTFYHLWYLPAALLGIVIVWSAGRHLSFEELGGIALALYVVGLFGDSYYGLTMQVPIFKKVYDMFFLFSSHTRNGLFYAPVFLVMGAEAYVGTYRENMRKSGRAGRQEKKTAAAGRREREDQRKDVPRAANTYLTAYAAGFVVSLVLMTGEGILLRRGNMQRHDSMYVMLLPVMFFLFRILLSEGKVSGKFRKLAPEGKVPGRFRKLLSEGKVPGRFRKLLLEGKVPGRFRKLPPEEKVPRGFRKPLPEEKVPRRFRMLQPKEERYQRERGKRLRLLSTWTYIIHPLCIILVRGAAKAAHMERLFVENSLLHYLTVCAMSCAGAGVIVMIAEKTAAHGPVFGQEESFEKGRAWIELSRENLVKNVETLQALLAPGQQLMPAVKADAYGHGAALIAGELNRMGIHNFCVACVSEGVTLRKEGITGDILILGYTHPKDFDLLRKYHLIQTVVDYPYGKKLNGYGKKLRVHVKIDTGMHRLGERAERDREISRLFRLKNLQIEGIYTHLCADETLDFRDAVFTKKQAALFYGVTEKLEEQGVSGLKTHLLASSGLFHYPELGGDYVRAGIALYGLLSESRTARKGNRTEGKGQAEEALQEENLTGETLPEENPAGERSTEENPAGERSTEENLAGETSGKEIPAGAGDGGDGDMPKLFPVLSLRARIAAVKEVYPGESIGYGCSYVAEDTRKIAVLAIGYADGLPRSLSGGRGRVLIHGQSAFILGRICMDQTIVDITDIPGVRAGEIATVIGRSGEREITAYELAENAGTITNEIFSRMGGRLQRILA